jgi:hypothetical protein
VTVRACFVSASGQNAFFDELLSALRTELTQAGVPTEEAVDHFPPIADDLVYVFVPHEYFPLTYPEAHPTGAQMGRTVVLSTEQPGTHWFEENAVAAEHAGATLDINALGARELERRGIATRLIRLGYVPEWDGWGGREDEPRPIDFTFLGGYNQRRARILSRCGPVLSDRRSAIHIVDTTRPHTISSDKFLTGEPKWRHLASSKIILNVHRDERPYLEWQRMLSAAANGCVVVTEHSLEVDPLVPGEHFISATAESLPYAVAALLHDEEGLAGIRNATYDFLREELPLSASIPILAEEIERVGQRPVRVSGRTNGQKPAPLPAEPAEPDPYWVRLLTRPDETDVIRMALKRLIVGQADLQRRVQWLEHPEGQEDDRITWFGRYQDLDPRVTVAVSLYNYEGYIAEALTSLAMSTFEEFEIVLVDDASTDDSLRVARETLERFPWLTGTIVARAANGGLPAARNLAFEHARADYVFILDADNVVYPHALERLAVRLDEDPGAAFAYGILEKFDAHGAYDLLSCLAWDPKLLRHGNYIDAMSLIRRTAFEAVGGYTTDPRLGGWEDLALWCAFAEAGMRGALVPEIVARYRAGRHSMISLTNIDASEAWSLLLERFPFLRTP